jgi:hypothetical protein
VSKFVIEFTNRWTLWNVPLNVFAEEDNALNIEHPTSKDVDDSFYQIILFTAVPLNTI